MSDLHSSWRIQLVETKKNICRTCFVPNQLIELTQIRIAKITRSMSNEEMGWLLLGAGMLCKNIPCARHKWKTNTYFAKLQKIALSLCYGLLAIQGQVKKHASVTFLSFLQSELQSLSFPLNLYFNPFPGFHQQQFFIQEKLTFGYSLGFAIINILAVSKTTKQYYSS